jgi:hypothetical protein
MTISLAGAASYLRGRRPLGRASGNACTRLWSCWQDALGDPGPNLPLLLALQGPFVDLRLTPQGPLVDPCLPSRVDGRDQNYHRQDDGLRVAPSSLCADRFTSPPNGRGGFEPSRGRWYYTLRG